jgi:heptosyltransferase I
VAVVNLKEFGDSPVRILVVKLSSFGDIIHATGALRALSNALPKAEITLAVEQRWADVVRHNPNLSAIIECSSQENVTMGYVAEVHRQLSKHRKLDVAIDFQGTRRSASWIYLSGARLKLGRGKFRPGWQFSAVFDRTRHAVAVCAEVCQQIGVPVDCPDPEIYTGCDEERRLDAFLNSERIPGSGFIVLNPFSRWASKSWPQERAAGFIDELKRQFGYHVILTGGADDQPQAGKLLRLLPPGTINSVVGRLPLGQSLCLFRRARLMVSCDSGPMHAAAAFGVPVVALFGPTHPEHTGPWGHNHCVVQRLRPSSHDAYRSSGQTHYMQAIESQMVLEAVSAKLAACLPQ